MPLPLYSPCMRQHEDLEKYELIKSYFNQGYSNKEIIEFLKLHDITISLSTLKRRLQTLKLSRRKQGTNIITDKELKNAMEEEFAGSSYFVWYRKMWARLKRKGTIVRRERERVMTHLRS